MSCCAALCSMSSYAQTPYPMTLEKLYQLADERSRAIRVGEAAVEEAAAALKVAQMDRLPDINLTLSASYLGDGCLTDRDFGHGQSVSMPHFGNNFAVEATQLIYGGGAVTQSIALARLKEEMASLSLEETRSRVRFMLTGFYLDLCKLQNLRVVYDRNIELSREVIADTEARLQQGVALKNDLTRYELQLSRLELARSRTDHAIEVLNYDLVAMLGLEAGTVIQPNQEELQQPLPEEGVAVWQGRAEEQAFSLRQGELAVQLGERSERLARAERLPKISLIAANHFDGPITIEVPVINKNFNYWFVGVGVSFPISSLYKAGKGVKRARLATTESRRALELQREELSRAVYADHVHYLETYEEEATLEKQVALAEENYAVVENRYRNGMVLVTDMLDAASRLLEAELQLVNVRLQTQFLYRKLQHTTGNL